MERDAPSSQGSRRDDRASRSSSASRAGELVLMLVIVLVLDSTAFDYNYEGA